MTPPKFIGPSCGHHGPYTFFRTVAFRKSKENRTCSISVGHFFFVRILDELPVCIGELQLLWESKKAVGTKLASVKLYFTPEDTPSGRLPHHGQDELLVADEKVVLEVDDLVKWIVDGPVEWHYGFKIDFDEKFHTPDDNIGNEADRTKNRFRQYDGNIASNSTIVRIVSFSQYCRYRAVAKRLEQATCMSPWNVVGQVMSGKMLGEGEVERLMFCRDTFAHPDLMSHDFRKDRLAPKLKGRKRRRKFSRFESVDSVDSDMCPEKTTLSAEDGINRKFKPMVRCSSKLSMSLPQAGMDVINSGKDTFERQLFKFMRERKTPIKRIPSLGFKEVDLFQFFIYAQKFGGYDKVTEGRHWKQIYDQLGGHPGNTSAATCTRRIYEKLLLTFERHVRGEDDKPLPATYMRPARKKLHSLALLNTKFQTVVTQDCPSLSAFFDISSHDATDPVSVLISSVESPRNMEPAFKCNSSDVNPEAPNFIKVETSSEAHQPILKTILNSTVEDSKDQSQVLMDTTPIWDQKSNRSELPDKIVPGAEADFDKLLSDKSTNATIRVTTGSLVYADQIPFNSRDGQMLIPRQTGIVSPFVAKKNSVALTSDSSVNPVLVSIKMDSTECPKMTSIKDSNPSVLGGMTLALGGTVKALGGATLTSPLCGSGALSVPDMPQPLSTNSNLMSSGFPVPNLILNPQPGTFSPIARPTYGPPNLIEHLTPNSNGYTSAPLDNVLRSTSQTQFHHALLSHQVNSSRIRPAQFPLTLGKRDSLGKPVVLPTSKRQDSTSSGVSKTASTWFNSPIKQFIDRTRATSAEAGASNLHEADDQPVDLSIKSLGKSPVCFGVSISASNKSQEQSEPLNLSLKQAAETSYTGKFRDVDSVTSSPSAPPGKHSNMIAPSNTDLVVPFILTVPSLLNTTSQAGIFSDIRRFNQLPVTSVCNSVSIPSKPPGANGFSFTPTVLSSLPFATSLVGTALPPVFQFFPSHPLMTPSIAYASEAGRQLLLRLPAPAAAVPVVVPAPAASLVVSKCSRS